MIAHQWTTIDQVKTHLGFDPASTVDDDWLAAAVLAANTFVSQQRSDVPTPGLMPEAYPDMIAGTTMLAARWYRRRNSEGEAGFDSFGPYPTSGLDRDVRQLLGLDRPVVA